MLMYCTLCVLSEGDSKNYLTYYKRAAVFLAMGKSKSALPDLTRAIQLKPDFLAVSFHKLPLILNPVNLMASTVMYSN